MNGNGRASAGGATAPSSGTSRFRDAKVAAADLRIDAETWLRLRGERLAGAAVRMLRRLLLLLLLAFVGVVALTAASVMLLLGASQALAEGTGLGTGVSMLIVGGAVVLVTALGLLLVRYGRRREDLDAAEDRLEAAMRASVQRVGRDLWTMPGVVGAAIAGLVSARVLRDARARRFAVVAISTLRTARRLVGRSGGLAAARRRAEQRGPEREQEPTAR